MSNDSTDLDDSGSDRQSLPTRRKQPECVVIGDMEQIVIDALSAWVIAEVGARLRDYYGETADTTGRSGTNRSRETSGPHRAKGSQGEREGRNKPRPEGGD